MPSINPRTLCQHPSSNPYKVYPLAHLPSALDPVFLSFFLMPALRYHDTAQGRARGATKNCPGLRELQAQETKGMSRVRPQNEETLQRAVFTFHCPLGTTPSSTRVRTYAPMQIRPPDHSTTPTACLLLAAEILCGKPKIPSIRRLEIYVFNSQP